jgi:hypothetical protein
LLAKSTHHPTIYNDPVGEGHIRGAIDELVKLPGFRAGPDTDTLTGENRGDAKSRRHFSGIGQRRATCRCRPYAQRRRCLFPTTAASNGIASRHCWLRKRNDVRDL